MTETQFWQIIQRSFDASGGDIDEQADALAEELEELSPEEITEFDRQFEQYRRQAYTWDLWGAAYVIGGGCSDDSFMDFRAWLVSRGKAWFERALQNPDALADYPGNLDEQSAFFEDFAYVATEIHQEKTDDIPDYNLPPHPEEPSGEPWPEDDDEVFRTRWPKLFAKYGNA